MTKKILSLTVLFLVTACSLPGGNDLNTPDETEKELKNPRHLEKIYAPLRGEYTLLLKQEGGAQTSQCVALEVDYKIVEEGKNSLGQPIFNVALYGKYTDVDSFINEEPLTGRYYKETGTVVFILPSKQQTGATPAPTDKTLQISGQLLNNNFNGDIRIEGYTSGNLRGSLESNPNCPSKSALRESFSGRLEQIFSGDWDGSAEGTSDITGFKTKLRINVQKIPTAGGYSYDVISTFDREPFGMLKPTPISLRVVLNQSPYIVNFTTVSGDWPRFYGSMKDADTIEGLLVYPAGSLKTIFKRKK